MAILLMVGRAGPAQAIETQSPLLGGSSGAFRAEADGSATYRVPVLAPPGIGAVQPALAFRYNSKGSNGLLGMGWALEGLPSITRCGATKAQDGFVGGIRFDANDRFCLDGQRLVALDGSIYGADGTEYRTEIDNFVRIVSYGSIGNGPQYFRAWTKAGDVMEFGGTADSRIEAPGKPSALTWAMNRIQDSSGCYLVVTYTENMAEGEYRPLRIDYTGHAGAGLAPTRRIEFEYETRGDVVTRFVAGSRVRLTTRLRKVAAYTGSALAREYVLTYEAAAAGISSKLQAIVECGGGTCLPAWQLTNISDRAVAFSQLTALAPSLAFTGANAETFVADVNGDGLADMVQILRSSNVARVLLNNGSGGFTIGWTSPASTSASGYIRRADTYASALGDVNGDGKADLVQIGIGTPTAYVLLSNGDGSFRTAWTSPASGDGSVLTAEQLFIRDVDGDGFGDIIEIQNERRGRVLRSLGNGAFTTAWTSPTVATANGYLFGTATALTYVGDLNGDTLPDILQVRTDAAQGRVLFGVGDGSFTTAWISPASTAADGFIYAANQPTLFGDFNGDGLIDVLQIWTSNNLGRILLSRGDGSLTAVWTSPTPYTADGGLISAAGGVTLVGDINGDGKDDVIQIYKNVNTAKALLSRGDGSLTTVATSPASGSGFVWNGQTVTSTNFMADVTGDGVAELIQLRNNTNTGQQIVQLRDGFASLLTQVQAPTGGRVVIAYEYITADSHAPDTGSAYPIIDQPQPEAVVVGSTLCDPRNQCTLAVTYEYGGAKYDLHGRGSLGFRWRRAIEQTPEGATTTTFFEQQFPATGAPTAAEVRANADPSVLRASTYLWSHVPTSSGSFFRRLDQTNASDCSGPVQCRHTGESFQYDTFGNLERTYRAGDLSTSADDRDEYTEWVVDIGAWLHRPKRVVLFGSGGELLRERWVSYDGVAYGSLGARGLPTREEGRLHGDRGTPGNLLVTTTHDAQLGTPLTVTDARGCTTTTQYETAHRTYPEVITTCLGHSTSHSYDPRWGKPLSYTDVNGQTTSYHYDGLGRLVRMVGPLDTGSSYGTASFDYLDVGTSNQRVATHRTEQHGTANVHLVEEYFDHAGRPVRVRSEGPAGQSIETETTFDARGLVASRSIPHFPLENAAYTFFAHDAFQRRTQVLHPDGTSVRALYRPGVTTITDERQRDRRYLVDAFAQLVGVEELNDTQTYVTSYDYDAAGTIRRIRNHLGHETVIEPDYLGRNRQISYPGGSEWTFDYDAAGDLKRQTDARNQSLTFTHDPHGRVTSKTYPDGTRIQWSYDDNAIPFSRGRLSQVVDRAGTTRFRYDQLGRVTEKQRVLDGVTYTLARSHDALGRVTREVFLPDGDVVDYEYNSGGWLSTVRDGASGLPYITQIDYNARGQRTQVQRRNGATSTHEYFDGSGDAKSFRLKQLRTSTPTGVIQDLSYQYDAAGNLLQITDGVGTAGRNYQYDALGRITEAVGTFGPGQSTATEGYAYDPIGNLVSKGGVVYAYTDLGHPSAVTARSDGLTYSYDANGSIATAGSGGNDWDADNRLAVATTGSGTSVQMAYDYTGRRVRKTVNGASTTRYPFGGYEIDPSGFTRKYFAGMSKASDGSTVYLHDDHLGSTHVVTDADGRAAQLAEYAPWGELARAEGAAEPNRRFTGQARDHETGLMYYEGRYYDPVLGRFLSADPVEGRGDAPQSYNRYSYVLNAPTRYTDPTGYWVISPAYDRQGIIDMWGWYWFGLDLAGWDLRPAQDYSLDVAGMSELPSVTSARPAPLAQSAPTVVVLPPILVIADPLLPAEATELGTMHACGPATPLCVAGAAAAGAGMRLVTTHGGRITSVLGNTLRQIGARIDKLKHAMDRRHVELARQEIAGAREGGHLEEIQNAQTGLLHQIERLNNFLGNPRITPEQRAEAQQRLSEASRMLDRSEGFFPR